MGGFRSVNVRQLLHNKFVVVLGDSIQRSVYKDLVKFLQGDEFLSEMQLRDKGEFTFENDSLIEGGQLNEMTNETTFREVRQYRSDHHLVRFYFLTRVYSAYLESILSDFQSGPQPDVLIVNSCVWDLNRYNDKHLEGYKTNLDHLFLRLKEVLSPQCLIIWTMTMPVGYRENDGCFQNPPHNLRKDIVEANLCSAILADFHHLDVLDMHYHFRYDLNLRCIDATHWNQEAHRKYTQILLTHIALAWGVKMPKAKKLKGSPLLPAPPHWFSFGNEPHPMQYPPIQGRERCSPGSPPFGNDNPLLCANMTPDGFTSPPWSDPTVSDYGGIYRGSPLLPSSPHQFSMENDPHPMPYPPIQERERFIPGSPPFGKDVPLMFASMTPNCFTRPSRHDPAVRNHGGIYRGSPLLPSPPHRFSLENDPHPMPYPPIQERERCGPGSPLLPTPPHRFSLENEPHPMLYPPIQERERCGPAPPSLGTRSPLLLPPDCLPLPPGPDFIRSGPMMPPPMNFGNFPPGTLHPREVWEMNMQPRKLLNSRGIRSHPYHSPPDHQCHLGSNDLY
ncbi:PC-esterase domain-containing protein 1A-like [Ranitomeya variabilis]|uniref:PC-esterase domain-containing protein 1A-like n=1 Tax=Ranitomeya variabilis TaxID=490064 RepID=UPI00405650D3